MGGFLVYPYIYSASGEWIGWATPERMVFSIYGHFVGTLSNEPRILRKRELSHSEPRRKVPPPPPPILPPSRLPLAPLMAELSLNVMDVLEEAPQLLPSVDFGDLRDDLD